MQFVYYLYSTRPLHILYLLTTPFQLISNRLITGGVGTSFYAHLQKYKNIQENNIDEERSYSSDLPTGLQRTLDEPRSAFMWVDYVVENMEGYGCLVSLYFSSIGFLVCMNIILYSSFNHWVALCKSF